MSLHHKKILLINIFLFHPFAGDPIHFPLHEQYPEDRQGIQLDGVEFINSSDVYLKEELSELSDVSSIRIKTYQSYLFDPFS